MESKFMILTFWVVMIGCATSYKHNICIWIVPIWGRVWVICEKINMQETSDLFIMFDAVIGKPDLTSSHYTHRGSILLWTDQK